MRYNFCNQREERRNEKPSWSGSRRKKAKKKFVEIRLFLTLSFLSSSAAQGPSPLPAPFSPLTPRAYPPPLPAGPQSMAPRRRGGIENRSALHSSNSGGEIEARESKRKKGKNFPLLELSPRPRPPPFLLTLSIAPKKQVPPPVARPKLTTKMISASIARPRVVAVRASKEAGASASKAVAVPKAASSVVDRRAALGMIAGVAAVVAAPSESKAAYGEAANVFGKVRTPSASSNWRRERIE